MISLDFFSRRPLQVILWGASNYIDAYLACLQEAGVQVLFAVDPCGKGMPSLGAPVKTLQAFRSELHRYAEIPIVALENRDDAYAADPWAAAIDIITRELGASHRVVDPVFICDRLSFNFHGRVVAGGFPGSGNAVIQAIIDRLIAMKPRSWSGKEHLMGFLVGQRIERLQDGLCAAVQLAGAAVDYSSVTVDKSDRVMLHVGTKEGGQAMLCDVPSRSHMHSDMHRTHQPLDVQSIDYFRSLGFEIFAAIRHPLDILISVARKLAADPQPMLTDLTWFRDVADALFRYTRDLEYSRQKLHCVRYEDLLAQPIETIRGVAAVLEIECSEEQLQNIWEAVGFKLLNRNPQHLWKPGAGKWRKYLTEKHLAIARELGIIEILMAKGYSTNLELGEPASPEDRAEVGQDEKSTAFTDCLYSVLYDMPRHVFHPDVFMDTSPILQCRYLTTSAANREAVRIVEESTATRSLLDSLPRWSDDGPPMLH